MKRLILLEFILLFLATTFIGDNPPGWVQQTLPRTDITVQDICFIDSLNGWIVARKNANDSAIIYKTTDSGNNWINQYQNNIYLTTIQFVDNNTGYSVGSAAPVGIVVKTTNSGNNWFTVSTVSGYPLRDVFFVNKDTGWTCSDDLLGSGLLKTTTGGTSWQQQLGASYLIKKLFFINKDTGWAISNDQKLYRTLNGGANWNLQYTFTTGVGDIFFTSNDTGIVTGGGSNGMMKTTTGGNFWFPINNPPPLGPGKIFMLSNKIGWIGCGVNKVLFTQGNDTWYYQYSPSYNTYSIDFVDSMTGWGGVHF